MKCLALETRSTTPVFLTGQPSAVQRAWPPSAAASTASNLRLGLLFLTHTHTKRSPREAPPAGPARSPQSPAGRLSQRGGREPRAALPRSVPFRSVPQAAASAAGTAPLRRRTLRLPVGASRPDGIAAGPSGQPSWAGALRVPRNGSGFCQESLSAERGRSAGRVPTEKSVTAISSVLFGPERKAQ